mmetsp:Transcript_57217/g.107335  ORF Transcript_57217/g.107335 Transcript_57217/m.107335 type:complete len:103 (+) Transcript_57217:377-685(+)
MSGRKSLPKRPPCDTFDSSCEHCELAECLLATGVEDAERDTLLSEMDLSPSSLGEMERALFGAGDTDLEVQSLLVRDSADSTLFPLASSSAPLLTPRPHVGV